MVFESIDKLVKEKFVSIYKRALNDSEFEYKHKYLPKFQDLSLFDQISFLKTEIAKIKESAEGNLNPVYFDNHSSEDWLLKSFSSRSVILNIDESDVLYQAVFMGEIEYKLFHIYHELEKSIPSYTLNDFLANKKDRYYLELDYFHHIPKDDYYKIRIWQTDKMMSIVNTEVQQIVVDYQNRFKTESLSYDLIQSNIDHFETLFDNSGITDPSLLISELKKFDFLKGYDFSVLNNSYSLEDFNLIVSNNSIFKKLTPGYIDSLRDRFNSGKHKPAFSLSPVIYLSILRLIGWLKEVVKKKDIGIPYIVTDYKNLYSKTIEEANKETDDLIIQFEDSNDIPNLDKDQVIPLYIDKIESLRDEYKQEGAFHYYYVGLNNMDDTLLTPFKINCFLNNDDDKNVADLKKAYILRESILFYLNQIYTVTGKREIYPDEKVGGVIEVMYLLHNMVLDEDLYKRMKSVMDDAMKEFQNSGLPFDLVRLDIYEGLDSLFSEAIDRLLSYLEDCEGSNKVLFIHSRLKQLKQRELHLKSLKGKGYVIDTGKYTTLFKEYLEIEADYIRDTKDINIIPSLAIGANPKLLDSPVKKPVKQTHNSLTYIKYNTDQSKLTDFYNTLIKQGFISDQTTLAAFRKIFTNQKPDPPIVWTGSVEELDFLIKYIHRNTKVIVPITRGIWDIVYECFDHDEQGKKFNRDSLGGQAPPPSAEFLRVAARHL